MKNTQTKYEKKEELYGIGYSPVEPYCYENDREEDWHQCGLHEGFDDGCDFATDKICEFLKDASKYIKIENGQLLLKKSLMTDIRKLMKE